jgi:hypothetical protein
MIIYTASHKCYADSVVNHIDPLGQFFQYRLYRHNCVKLTGPEGQTIYIKDLRIIRNVPLENMIIIDNSVLSFAFHLENGIPILPFYSNKDDTEMETLRNYLGKLAKFDNITINNGATFNLRYLLEEAVRESNEPHDDNDEGDDISTAHQSTNTGIVTPIGSSKVATNGKDTKERDSIKHESKKGKTSKTLDKNEIVRTKKGDNLEELKQKKPTRRKSKITNLIYENMEKVKK